MFYYFSHTQPQSITITREERNFLLAHTRQYLPRIEKSIMVREIQYQLLLRHQVY